MSQPRIQLEELTSYPVFPPGWRSEREKDAYKRGLEEGYLVGAENPPIDWGMSLTCFLLGACLAVLVLVYWIGVIR